MDMYTPQTYAENASYAVDREDVETAKVHAQLAIAAAIERLAKAVESLEQG